MTSAFFLYAYAALGSIAALALLVRPRPVAGLGRAPAVASMLVFWPFLVPAVFFTESPPSPAVAPAPEASERALRIDDLAARLADALAGGSPGLTSVAARERIVLDRFVERLRASEQRILALASEQARAGSASLRDKLAGLQDAAERDLDESLRLLDEVVSQLVLLRFTVAGGRAGADLDGVESLLARIEALATLSGAGA